MPGAPRRSAAGSTCGARHTPRAPRPGPRWPGCWGCRHEPCPSAPGHRLGFVRMTTASATTKPGTRGWLAEPLVATALVLAILAAGFAVWSAWSWYQASSAGPPASAQLRDEVLQAGEQAVQNFNTLDYRKVAAGLALWEQSSTGALHTEISAGRSQFES